MRPRKWNKQSVAPGMSNCHVWEYRIEDYGKAKFST